MRFTDPARSFAVAAALLLMLLMLQACGGGGGGGASDGNGTGTGAGTPVAGGTTPGGSVGTTPAPGGTTTPTPPTPAPTYGLSATVTGLRGSLLLSSRVGPDALVTASGEIALGAAQAGTAFDIRVAQQPASQRCTVTAGAGVVETQAVRVAVDCRNVLTASRSVVRAGEIVTLDGAPATPNIEVVRATLLNQPAISARHANASVSFLVPTLPSGAQVLTVMLGGEAYDFAFEVVQRAASEPAPDLVVASAVSRAAQAIALLEGSTDPARLAVAAELRQQLQSASARMLLLSPAEQQALASYLENFQTRTAALNTRQWPGRKTVLNEEPNEPSCWNGSLRFAAEVAIIVDLIPIYAAPPSWWTLGAIVTQSILMSDIYSFIQRIYERDCFKIKALRIELEQAFVAQSGQQRFMLRAPASGLPAAGTSRRLAVSAGPAAIEAMHGVPVTLRAEADGEMLDLLLPSAQPVQTLLNVASNLLPSSIVAALRQWTPAFKRSIDFGRYTVQSVSSSRVSYSHARGTPGSLNVSFSYKPGLFPAQPETLVVNFIDDWGRQFSRTVRLSMPDLPTLDGAQINTALGRPISGLFVATGAQGFKVLSQPAKGLLEVVPGASGRFTYSPRIGQAGPDTFKVVAFNTRGESDEALFSVNINRADVLVAMAATPNPANFGGQITLTATVTGVGIADPLPSGTVTFTSDTPAFPGCSTLSFSMGMGSCTVLYPSDRPTTVNFTATYSGDASFSGGNSTPYPLALQYGEECIEEVLAPFGGAKRTCFYGGNYVSASKWVKSIETFYRYGPGESAGVISGTIDTKGYEPGNGYTSQTQYTLKPNLELDSLSKNRVLKMSGGSLLRAAQGVYNPQQIALILFEYNEQDILTLAKTYYNSNPGTVNPLCEYWEEPADAYGRISTNVRLNRRVLATSECPTRAQVEAVNDVDYRQQYLFKLNTGQ